MVTLNRPSEIAFHHLMPGDKTKVKDAISTLGEYVEDPRSNVDVLKVKASRATPGNIFMVRATPELRILFKYDESGIKVVDIVHFDRLKRMHALAV